MTKPKSAKKRSANLYGRTTDGPSILSQTRVDTAGLPHVEFRRLDTRRAAFRHLDSSRWRRGDRSLVTVTSRVGYHDKDGER